MNYLKFFQHDLELIHLYNVIYVYKLLMQIASTAFSIILNVALIKISHRTALLPGVLEVSNDNPYR